MAARCAWSRPKSSGRVGRPGDTPSPTGPRHEPPAFDVTASRTPVQGRAPGSVLSTRTLSWSTAMPTSFNHAVIEEFRANQGKVAHFPDGDVLLLTTTGAKSG